MEKMAPNCNRIVNTIHVTTPGTSQLIDTDIDTSNPSN